MEVQRYKKNCLLALTLMALLMSCKSNSDKGHSNYSLDPALEVFYGSRVKFMLSERHAKYTDTSFVDTTAFDRSGNIIKVQEFGRIWKQKAYDDLHRVIRYIEYFEVRHLAMSYDTVGNYVIETNVRIQGANWEDGASEIRPCEVNHIIYRLDEMGRVQEKLDLELTKTITNFVYNGDKLVEKNEVPHSRDDRFSSQTLKWRYQYDGSKLLKVEKFYRDSLLLIQYFDKIGLPKFTCDMSDPSNKNDTVIHRYIYY